MVPHFRLRPAPTAEGRHPARAPLASGLCPSPSSLRARRKCCAVPGGSRPCALGRGAADVQEETRARAPLTCWASDVHGHMDLGRAAPSPRCAAPARPLCAGAERSAGGQHPEGQSNSAHASPRPVVLHETSVTVSEIHSFIQQILAECPGGGGGSRDLRATGSVGPAPRGHPEEQCLFPVHWP